jgi:DASS family divalent anion:Na+ symporter
MCWLSLLLYTVIEFIQIAGNHRCKASFISCIFYLGLVMKNPVISGSLISLGLSALIWSFGPPEGVKPEAWNLFAIFFATILGIITKPFPMGAVSIFALTTVVMTKTLTFNQAFASFSDAVAWLIVMAFLIARGFIKSGLGNRIAFYFIRLTGRHSLGLAYGMLATDLVMAPGIPSIAARSGGMLLPILISLANAFDSHPKGGTSRKIGSFLIQSSFHGSVVTGGMFMTAMAANPLMLKMAESVGVQVSWGQWATAAIVPGLVSLAIIPLIIYWLYPPEIKHTPHAIGMARQKLEEMGPMSYSEKVMTGTLALLLTLWSCGPFFGVSSIEAALVGVSILLITGVLDWEDVRSEKSAWETFVWFSALITMASYLNHLGMINWFSDRVLLMIGDTSWQWGLLIISLIYFYSHYFFASQTAHASSMFAPFLVAATTLGAPPLLATMILCFISNLYGCLTHYACSPAPLLFGAGYVSIADWWKIGFIMSLVHFAVWGTVGIAWWSFLGIF